MSILWSRFPFKLENYQGTVHQWKVQLTDTVIDPRQGLAGQPGRAGEKGDTGDPGEHGRNVRHTFMYPHTDSFSICSCAIPLRT